MINIFILKYSNPAKKTFINLNSRLSLYKKASSENSQKRTRLLEQSITSALSDPYNLAEKLQGLLLFSTLPELEKIRKEHKIKTLPVDNGNEKTRLNSFAISE